MAVAHKSVISFGLVAIPISMYTAVQDNDIHFNQLHKEDDSRIKYKKTCSHCGEELSSKDIIKGYEYDEDHYVVVTEEDLEKIKTEKDKSIQILHFAQLNQISPIFYDKTYQAIPEAGGDKAFELLRLSLMSEQKIAIGKTVMGTKEALVAIIPREDGILISTMFYEDEIKDLPKSYSKPEISEAELNMAKTLISSMDAPFNPSEYKDEYQIRLRELIETKIAGKEIIASKNEVPNNIINLMDALKASIEQNEGKDKVKPKRKRTPKGA
ncbi:Ku protein [Candidatus Clostridium stratigraminis]|uniref:Non-homologous end joining protein Ku n=1 Tax=Candidatus Clostridium stratigraminis TaxID=3381661 RepID=A0ABW8T3A9_9CLOT